MKYAARLGLLLFLTVFWPVTAAEITLPRLEMASRGRMDNGEFVLSSMIFADLALTGGYKYAFILGFYLDAPDIGRAFAYRNFRFEPLVPLDPAASPGVTEDDYNAVVDRSNTQADMLNNQVFLGFRVAQATARDVFGLPLEMSYFIGAGDDFCTGDEFMSRFGTSPIGTDFRGFFYFPEGIGGIPTRQYNGVHGVRGTGLSFSLTRWDSFVPMVYVYQEFTSPVNVYGGTHVFGNDNLYSGDLRLLLHHSWLGIEAFGGVSLTASLDNSVRAGLMLHLAGENGAEFFVQGGIPGFVWGEKISIDNLFFLIEPRLRFGLFGVSVTFFYHPVEYLHIITPEEKGRADINVKFQVGNADTGFAGGIETGGELKIDGLEDFVLRISPFVSFVSDGLRWDAKVRVMPLDYKDRAKMFDFFIGVRTAF